MFGRLAKTAESIEVLFRVWIPVGPRNHVLDGVQIAPCQGAIFRGNDMSGHSRRQYVVSCAKMAEPIEMPFVLWTRVGPRQHLLGGVHSGATWRKTLNRPYAPVMRRFCPITLTTCCHRVLNLQLRQRRFEPQR